MVFVDNPPPELGEIRHSWTNNGPDGPAPRPLMDRLLGVMLGAMGGFVVGLIGFFVVGGIRQHQGLPLEAAWFLYALGGGGLVGALLGLPFALRRSKVLTLYVGRDGCAQISGGEAHLLDFRTVERMRPRVNTLKYKGIGADALEIHVTQNGRERFWYVCAAKPKTDDPGAAFGHAVLEAYRAR